MSAAAAGMLSVGCRKDNPSSNTNGAANAGQPGNASATGAAASSNANAEAANPPAPPSDPPKAPAPGAPKEGDIKLPPGGVMPMRKLGTTGEMVSLLGLGGFHIGLPKEESEALRIVHTAMDHGVTFMDNCWDYNKGVSEERLGKALADGRRGKVFLMTKLDGRTKDAATRQLEQSMKRLKTDRIDLVQIHEVIRFEDPQRVFAPGGAIEALVAAKQAGKIRFIGFTGHKDPDIHLAMLAEAKKHGFHFDTVQMPVNAMDPHFKSFTKKVTPVLQQEGIGLLGMKSIAAGVLLESNTLTARECLHFAMSQPTSVVINGCETVGLLEQGLEAAMSFKQLGKKELLALLARTKEAGSAGKYEHFKTSGRFDGTAQNPKWLEGATL